ncbi:MAG: hypothetical protein BMS9Abin23_0394 [Thermodesulfobacteriota bacterium]|nr:MAG: hypothetical protein BMS9Abin23_0394 [Thermodesulfobacteriota bacterium]
MRKRFLYNVAAALFFVFVFHGTPAHGSPVHGFVEGAYGAKFGDDRAEKNTFNLADVRLQLKYSYFPGFLDALSGEVYAKGEALADGYDESLNAYFRELNLFLRPSEVMDIKAGRQILTWGTGDFLFINDLFPKDYVSFFTGRDDEYLKLPSDALRVWLFLDSVNLDFVLIPFFEPNSSIRGDRLSFFDGLKGEISGQATNRTFVEPAVSGENMEFALRAYRNIRGYEAAFYFFNGFYKEPRGILDAAKEKFFYPRLRVYGFSLRGVVPGGIGTLEVGYYDSRNDPSGRDGNIENSSIKYLAGYTRDLGGDLKAGIQYEVDQILDYGGYTSSLSLGSPVRDEFRHLLTLRLTKLFLAQTLKAGLFAFYSPSDRDVYLRPSLSYDVSDNLRTTVGANIFSGRFDYTEFGSLEGNNNVYLRARYSF